MSEVWTLNELRSEKTRRAIDLAQNEIAKLGRLTLSKYVRLGWHVLEPARPLKLSWHIDAICEHLYAVELSEIIRLAISMPPGCMKSMLCSVFFPTHIWGPGGDAAKRFLGFSHDKALSTRDAVKSRRLIQSDWYQTLWGDRFTLQIDQNTKTRYDNDQTGYRIADYVGSGTGERGDIITIDDPHEVSDAFSFTVDLKQLERAASWLHETLPTRVNDPETSGIVCIHHRIHRNDMIGDILASNLGYEHLNLPMEYEPRYCSYTKVKKEKQQPKWMYHIKSDHIWLPDGWRPETIEDNALVAEYKAAEPELVYRQDPRTKPNELLFAERFTREVVDRDKGAMTTYAVDSQFQQRPTSRQGNRIKRHWFEIVQAVPADCQWVRWFDLAATEEGDGAFTAGVLMGRSRSNKMFYIRDVVRDRLAGDAVKKLIKQTAALDLMALGRRNYSIWLPQDPGQAGKVQAQDFTMLLVGYDVHTLIESGDKETRADPFAAQAEAGNVKLLAAPWNEPYLAEAAGWPSAKIKDQIDASSGAFGVLITYKQQSTVISTTRGAY